MKKHIYKLFVLLLLATFGCNNLKENPIGLLAPESFFTNKADAESAVMGAYATMANIYDYGYMFMYLTDLPSDLMIGRTTSSIQISNFNSDPYLSTTSNWWNNSFAIVSASNNAVSGIPNIDESDEIKNQLIAEARAIRAYTYFRLVRIFGDVPYFGEFIDDPASVKDVTRTPKDEIYQHIIDDLDYAIQYLPNTHKGDMRTRVSKGTAYTILADVYLTLENWQKAAENAEYVINHASDFGYGLVDDFIDLFNPALDDLQENIWIVDFSSTNDGYPYNHDYLADLMKVRGSDYNGWGSIYATEETYNSFDNRDYRKEVTFLTEAPFDGILKNYSEFPAPYPHIKKWCAFYLNELAASVSDLNVNVYRYAEVLLIAAEALNEINGGPTAEAYDYINQVRARARNYGGTPSDYPTDLVIGMSYDEFLEAVIEERRVEFAYEFKRWFDICRRNLFQKVFTGTNSTEPHESWKELFPIPQTEIDINPNLTQNPDYN